MEPSQFNDFIKSKTQDELPVPTELSWENMNFTVPPAKRKRRILPFMLFSLIGAVGMGGIVWYVFQQDNTQSQSPPKYDPIGIQNQNNKIILKEEDASVDMAHPQDAGENTVTRNNVTNQENFKTERLARTEMAHPQDAEENTITGNNAKNQENFKTERLARIEMEESKSLSLSQASKSNDIESVKAESLDLTAASLLAGAEKTKQIRKESLVPYMFLNALPIEPICDMTLENHVTMSFSAYNGSQTKQLTKAKAILVNIGANRAQMNYSSAGMNNTETTAWGNSYQILFEQEMKNNWLISLGLGYQRLHTTFYFEKDLGTYVDFSRLQVIRQTRRVFHNNYFDFVSLNLGGGKQFKLSPRWQAQLLLYLSPSHLLSYTGKSIDDAEAIVAFDANSGAQSKWLLNADAALRLSYNLNKTDLIIGFNLSQSLTKSDIRLVGNSMTTVQPQVFSLNLGIKRFL